MPGYRQDDFTLGRWFILVAATAFAYTAAVIVIALAPHEGLESSAQSAPALGGAREPG